ncbi:hypothetical protein M514_10386 [Trichuris suis]|uniref:Uncharacterized protein n=1 Tax=Trichuris suis TaxID=68888 RepID=A0A085NEJ5_9BILA|nr:hypothetical protein M513_10386 [Trichuris suis]KFD67891.1 hypothetical protein M514_10386 [Trichuris suis]KHJ46046.1 hypothetical protein D918_03709 [Trichuris suis]
MSDFVLENNYRQRITALELALCKIAYIKHNVKLNTEAVKKEVHRSFAQQVCYLRQREQQLIDQVETISKSKNHYLSQQERLLQQNLAVCKDGLQKFQKATKASGSSERCSEEFRDFLNSFYLFDLEPCESPNIFFKVNHDALRKAIFLFGDIKIDKHFKTPTSLPYALEDYDEEELLHSLLGKKRLPFSNTVSMRRPWPLTDPDSLALCRTLTANISNEDEEFKGVVDSSCTTHSVSSQLRHRDDLHNWLHYIKNNAEMEPTFIADRFVLANTGSDALPASTQTKAEGDLCSLALEDKTSSSSCDSFERIGSNASTTTIRSIEDQFKKILNSSASQWLSPSVGATNSATKESALFDVRKACVPLKSTSSQQLPVQESSRQCGGSDTSRSNVDASAALTEHCNKIWKSENSLWLPKASVDL